MGSSDLEIKMTIDTRGLNPDVRQRLVKEKASGLNPGDVVEVISDDDRMPKVAYHIAKVLGIIELIDVVKKEDGLYHGYFKRK